MVEKKFTAHSTYNTRHYKTIKSNPSSTLGAL